MPKRAEEKVNPVKYAPGLNKLTHRKKYNISFLSYHRRGHLRPLKAIKENVYIHAVVSREPFVTPFMKLIFHRRIYTLLAT